MKRPLGKRFLCTALICVLAAQPMTALADTITAGGSLDSMSGPGAANWIEDEHGWWYRKSDGTYPKLQWEQVKGKWYYFDETGYMKTGLFQVEGKFYYTDETGAMIANQTIDINGVSYAFGEDGSADPYSIYKQPVVMPPEEEKTDLMRADDAMADQILARITNSSMTDRQKAVAIYNWVRGNLTYSVSGTVGDWSQAASEGLRRRRGNCYTFYATSLVLLSRAGIPSIEVIRSRDNDHWWNLVYVDGAWYHFDTTPRRAGGDFCLLTTGQLLSYSRANGNSHMFDAGLYPPTP